MYSSIRGGLRPLFGLRRLLIAAFTIVALTHSALAATTTITSADNGKSIQLKSLDTLVVRLDSNVSTGFSWSVLPTSTPLLKLQDRVYKDPEQPVPGRGGTQVLTFQAVSPGTGVLTLHYVRPWEKADPMETRFTVNITIQ